MIIYSLSTASYIFTEGKAFRAEKRKKDLQMRYERA